MKFSRQGPANRGPFAGPEINNLGTGETTRAPLFVNAPWKRWAAPEIFPNVAALVIVSAAPLQGTIDPTFFRRPTQQIDVAPNIAALVEVEPPKAIPAPIDPPIYRSYRPQIDVLPNLAVNLQTIQPAGMYLDPPHWATRPPVPEVFPNLAVNLQTIRPAGTYIDPQTWKPKPAAPDLAPNLAAFLQTIRPAGTYIDPVRWAPRPPVPDLYPNIAVNLQTIVPAGAYIEPTVWRARSQVEAYPNIAVTVVVSAYVPPAPVEPTAFRRPAQQPDILPNVAALAPAETVVIFAQDGNANPSTRWTFPEVYPNIAVNLQTITLAGTYLDPTRWVAKPALLDVYPNVAVLPQPSARPVPPIDPWIAKRLPPQIDIFPNPALYAPAEAPLRPRPQVDAPVWKARLYLDVYPALAPLSSSGPVTVTISGQKILLAQGLLAPTVVKLVGRIVTIPKYLGTTALLSPPFNFAQALAAGETLLTAATVATVYTGVDANPSAILQGGPQINGASVNQMMTGGILGCVYDVVCTVTTNKGQTLQQSTYFYVEPYLP